jgi:demethylmenaquinone methyltransferase/2-methoxy-6-polyprenyl-1,4-benzoquinol methylase
MTTTRQIGAEAPVRAPHPILHPYYTSETAKRVFVQGIFDETATDYDRVDRVLAFGTGSWYRRQALLRTGLAPGMRVLDVAVGTGLLSRQIVRILGTSRDVVGIDPSAGMLASSKSALATELLRGRAEALPFADASFDFLSLGFALRHVEDMEGVFREFKRVLRPGGLVLALEITRPDGRLANGLVKFYMRGMVPLMSRFVARHRNTPRLYRYYWDTIESCAPPERVLATLASAGFEGVRRHVELGIFSEYCGRA